MAKYPQAMIRRARQIKSAVEHRSTTYDENPRHLLFLRHDSKGRVYRTRDFGNIGHDHYEWALTLLREAEAAELVAMQPATPLEEAKRLVMSGEAPSKNRAAEIVAEQYSVSADTVRRGLRKDRWPEGPKD
jgi:hypothetical protein